MALEGTTILVAGVHLGHLSHGSPSQVGELRRSLRHELPTVLLGDMNCWGPPLLALLPAWRRAVRGRSWPAWRPHSQIDHILFDRGLRVLSGEVLPALGSDHRPIRATLAPEGELDNARRRRFPTAGSR